jgi:tetratricopeptide (TPR) repeat protein
MRSALFVRAFAYLLIGGLFCAPRLSHAQQPPSSAKPSIPEGAEDGDARHQFSQSLAQSEIVSRSPLPDAESSLRNGLLRGQAGDFAGAIKAFEHALEVQPDFAEAHYNLGLALLANSGNIPAWTDALAQFQAAVALRPDYSRALRMAGVALLESGDASKASTELELALRLDPSSAEAHFELGRALAAAGNSSAAYPEYLTALKLKFPYPDADDALATILLTRHENEAAIRHFNAALAAQPDFESAHYGLAKALKAAGKTEKSRLELKAASLLIKRQSDAVMSSHLSNESLDRAKQGDTKAAMELAKNAIWLNPVNALANFNLGLLLADAGALPASIHQIRKAISLAPFKIVFYLDLARVQQKAGDQAGAGNTLRRAMQIDPADPALSAAVKKSGMDNQSTPSSPLGAPDVGGGRFAFGASSDTADDHFAFATRLSDEGDYIGAIGEMRQALSFETARADIRYNMAIAAAQIGRYDDAEYELENVLRLTPDFVPAYLALGSLFFEQKDLANAASELRETLKIQPGNQQALKLLRQCQPGAEK